MALFGFGQTGCIAGLMSITGQEDSDPFRAGISIGDLGGGVFLALKDQGIIAAEEQFL